MSRQLYVSRLLALVGLFALVGCGADDGKSDSSASGGTEPRPPVAGTGGLPSSFGGRPAGGGTSSYVPAGSGGSWAGGGTVSSAGAAGIGGSGGRATTPAGGSAGAGGATAASAGSSGTAGSKGSTIPVDPRCSTVRPVQGASCDGRGPVLCPSGSNECVCFGVDESGPTWTCVDVDEALGPGQGEGTIELGFGGAGGSGLGGRGGAGGTTGELSAAGREVGGPSFAIGGSGVQTDFSF